MLFRFSCIVIPRYIILFFSAEFIKLALIKYSFINTYFGSSVCLICIMNKNCKINKNPVSKFTVIPMCFLIT